MASIVFFEIDRVEPKVAIGGDGRIVDVALSPALAVHAVEVGVHHDVAGGDAELGQEALGSLTRLADEDPAADRFVRRRVLSHDQHPRGDSLATYELAVTLAQRCQQMLDQAELRITRLRESITAGAYNAESSEDDGADEEDLQ